VPERTETENRWLRLAPRPRARPPEIRWDVFVSYRSVNRTWAMALYDSLREAGYEVFLDQFVLPAGTKIDHFLSDNLQASASGVVIWSGDAATSEFVEAELEEMRALKKDRKTFFYVLANLDAQPLPFRDKNVLYVDFASYPEGPRGGELLRLMFGLLGKPLSDEAAREIQAVDVATTALVKEIRAARSGGNLEVLRRIGADGGTALTTTSVPWGVLVESLIEMGAHPEALEAVARARAQFPQALRLQQLEALALRRSGRIEDAQLILNRLYDDKHRDPETVGILAATWMQRYKKDPRRLFLEKSQALYAEAFSLSLDSYYNGINAASKAALLGRVDVARDLAIRVLPLVENHEDGRDYWATATHAEARLLAGEYERAARIYRAAVVAHPTEAGSIGSTKVQATDLLDKLGAEPADRAKVLDAFSMD
jgi:tetratricopeptide (TPR) repeat protein